MSRLEIDMPSLISTMTIQVKVRGFKWVMLRFKIAMPFYKIATWISGIKEIEFIREDE